MQVQGVVRAMCQMRRRSSGEGGERGEGCCHGVRESEMDVDTVVVCVIVC